MAQHYESDRCFALRLAQEDAASLALARQLAAASDGDDAGATRGRGDEHSGGAAAAGAADDDDDVVCVGVVSRSAKRARREASPPAPRRDGVGFSLYRALGAPARHNVGSVNFADLVPGPADASGPLRWVLWSNVHFRREQLLGELCPALLDVPRVFLLCDVKVAEPHDGLPGVRADFAALPRFTVHTPPLADAYGSHHAKFTVCVYSRRCCVAVHTANDARRDGTPLTEAFWSQSFPLKTAASPQSSDFEAQLVRYLVKTGWPGGDVAGEAVDALSLSAFDFSGAAVALVATVPGSHSRGELHAFGHMRLRALLAAEKAFDAAFVGSHLLFQPGATATVTKPWLREMFASFGAGAARDGTPLGAPDLGGDDAGGPSAAADDASTPHAALMWPTVEEIRRSSGGWGVGGGIPGPKRAVEHAELRRRHCRWRGGPDTEGRAAYPAHAKTFCRYDARSGDLAWFMLGSHNFSRAAWGELTHGGQVLSCKSYELAVVFLPSLASGRGDGRATRLVATAANGGTPPGLSADGATLALRLPYALPPTRYAATDAPWCSDDTPLGELDENGCAFVRTPEGVKLVQLVQRQ